jgi:hypothetical protein
VTRIRKPLGFSFFSSMLFAALPVCAPDDPKVARSRYDDLAAKVNSEGLTLAIT